MQGEDMLYFMMKHTAAYRWQASHGVSMMNIQQIHEENRRRPENDPGMKEENA